MNSSSKRIAFAYYLENWCYENGNASTLQTDGRRIVPSEYIPAMEGHIFCPVCFTNLTRIPKDKDFCSDGREAYFSHMQKYKDVTCDLRAKIVQGERYDTYEEAKQAIDEEELVIIHSFMKEKPKIDTESKSQNPLTIESQEGPLSDIPIGRHKGDTYRLPSRIKTVKGLCRNFDQNLYKYFHIPGNQCAKRLIDLLHNVESVTEIDGNPKLYFGKITSTHHMGDHKRPDNIRMTYFKYNQDGIADFCLKATAIDQQEHGIGGDSVGRYVILYGKVTINGWGLCFENLAWGEFALLPEKYNQLLVTT